MATVPAPAPDADSWTVVKPKNRHRPSRSVFDHPEPVRSPAPSLASPADIDRIRREHAQVAADFRALPSCRQVEAWVASNIPTHEPVARAVCLGAGSFGGPLDGGEAIRRAHVQTAVFLAIAEILGRHTGSTIPCVFQEPLYSDADRRFLEGLGHAVVDSPAAVAMIAADTFVFGIHLPTRAYLDCLAGEQPALLVGSGYDCYNDLPQFATPETSMQLGRLQQIHRSFTRLDFPQEKHDHCFSSTCLYWRPLHPGGQA